MAPYTYDSGRLTILGTIDGNQTWSINIGFLAPNPNSADLQTWLATLDTPISTWWSTASGPSTINKASTKCTGTRAEFYPAGATIPTASATHGFASALVGIGTSPMPTQAAMVASLLTGRAGKSYRGRLYLPATSVALASNSQPGNAVVDGVCNATATLLHAINISTLAGSAPEVIVRGHVATPGLVTAVRVDSELDVQRRRADKLVAGYVKTATV